MAGHNDNVEAGEGRSTARWRFAPALLAVLAASLLAPAPAPAAYEKVGGFPTVASPDDGMRIDGDTLWTIEGDFPLGPYGVSRYRIGGGRISWWQQGASNDFPARPWAIALDPDGNVVVTDFGGSREGEGLVHVLDRDDGDPIRVFGPPGSEAGELSAATGVGVDSAGNHYVSDGERMMVLKYAPNGAFLKEWSLGGWPRQPWGIDVDPAGNVYVAQATSPFSDPPNGPVYSVYKFDGNGNLLQTFGDGTDNRGKRQVALDRFGNVLAHGADGVTIYSPGGAEIASFRTRLRYGSGAIEVDSQGTVYIANPEGSIDTYAFVPPAPVESAPVRPGRPKLRKGPKGKTRSRKAVFVFRFRSPTPGARFQCRLTGRNVPKRLRRWRPCRSPKRYTRLRPGKKVFWVRAVKDGLVGKPDRRRWRVIG